jgi:hypothetical protein
MSSLLTVTGLAAAQGIPSGVTESTDPAKAAAVEQKAQQLQQQSRPETPSATPKSHKHRMHKHKHMMQGAKPDAEAKDAPKQ